MNYAQLRSFHAVAQEGGFSAAARKLKVSQPSVTYQVRQLETAFAVELFHRCGRRVEMTDLGASLLTLTRRFFSVEEETAHLLKSASELSTGTLKVGAGGRCHIMKMLATFRQCYPGAHVAISINNSEQNLKSLRDYEVDIAIFSDLQRDITHLDPDSRLFTIQIDCHPLVLFVGTKHPWAHRKSVACMNSKARTWFSARPERNPRRPSKTLSRTPASEPMLSWRSTVVQSCVMRSPKVSALASRGNKRWYRMGDCVC